MVQFDTRLPMMTQTPNVLGAVQQGTQMAGQVNALRRLAEEQNLYRQHGQGIASGDPTAMNALAQFNPGAAFDMTRQRAADGRAERQLGISEAQLGMAREAAARAAEQHVMQMDAAEAAREAALIEQGLMKVAPLIAQARDTGDVTALNQGLRTLGLPPVQSADEAMLLAAQHAGVYETLKRAGELTAGPPPLTNVAKLQADYEAGRIDQATYEAALAKATASDGMALELGPDGTMRMAQGGATQGFKFTEAQSKDNVYATRAEGALALLDSVGAEAMASRGDRVADAIPLGIGREFQSEDFQVAQQAGEEFLQAILRKDTGAAITSQEQDLYGKTYLPQPGDGPRVIEAKRQARIRAIEALKSGMNIQQLTVSERALINAAERASDGTNQGSGSSRGPQKGIAEMSMEELDALDLSTLSDEEFRALQDRMAPR